MRLQKKLWSEFLEAVHPSPAYGLALETARKVLALALKAVHWVQQWAVLLVLVEKLKYGSKVQVDEIIVTLLD